MAQKLRTVFFGSGPVALKSLELLVDTFELEAIVTKPATKAIMERVFPAVPVFAVSRRAELDALCAEQKFESQFGLLIDFGIIVSQDAINSFPLGIINSHFSLLPEWRGADPITFSILSGQTQTGVSLMLLVTAMDEGPLLAQAPLDIAADATSTTLTRELIELSDALLKEVIPQYVAGDIDPAPQETASLLKGVAPSYSRKLTKEDGRLDWSKPAAVLEREIRAFIEWPHSYTTLAGKDVIVTAAHTAPSDSDETPGQVEALPKEGTIKVGTSNGYLCIDRLKPAGKAEMSTQAFLAGYGRLFN